MKIVDKIKEMLSRKNATSDSQEITHESIFFSTEKFPNNQDATLAFLLAKENLFNINSWNNCKAKGFTFTLYDESLKETRLVKTRAGNYIKIYQRKPELEAWFMIHEVFEGYETAELVIKPINNPNEENGLTDSYFAYSTYSSFKITVKNTILNSYKSSKYNKNTIDHPADIDSLNTKAMADASAVIKKYPWKKLTNYLIQR
jgi:hypothetical protein